MGASNLGPEMLYIHINNIELQLENIRSHINNLFLIPNILPMSGLEMIKTGIKFLNLCISYSKLEIDISNFKNNIQNYAFQLHNLGNQLQNLGQYPQLNKMNMQNFNNNNNFFNKAPMKSIFFESKEGEKCAITLPSDSTLDNLYEAYFERNPQLNEIKYKVYFLYASKRIPKNNETKIQDYFMELNPKVYVLNDSLFGG